MQLADATRQLRRVFSEAVRPPVPLTVAAWAEKCRRLPDHAAKPGKWNNATTPYLVAIMEALSYSDPCERVALMKGSQIGGTEVMVNWVGWTIDHSPTPMMLVQPTLGLAKDFSKQRLAPMIESSPTVRAKVAQEKSRNSDNTILSKAFQGGFLSIAGANVAKTIASKPCGRAAGDEIDGWAPNKEGDALDQVEKRLQTFVSKRKLYVCSTPTETKTSRILKIYNVSDRMQLFIPCPRCGQHQVLVWEQIKYEAENPRAAWYECIFCHGRIDEAEKPWMLERHEWRATAQGDGQTRGFKLPSFYSPWLAWGKIALDFEEVKGDPERLKVWKNHYCAETWDDSEGARPDPLLLLKRLETPETPWHVRLPAGAVILTAAGDVQPDRVELEIVAWGQGQERWSVGYYVVPGDTLADSTWDGVWAVLSRRFAHPLFGSLEVAAACIDARHNGEAVMAFCRKHRARQFWAVMGLAGRRPIWGHVPQKSKKRGGPKGTYHQLGVNGTKSAVYSALATTDHGPGYCHYSTNRDGVPCDADYFDGLTAEEKLYKRDKKSGIYVSWWYKPEGSRNEPLDVAGYNYGALMGLRAQGRSIDTEIQRLRVRAAPEPEVPAQPRRESARPEASHVDPSEPTSNAQSRTEAPSGAGSDYWERSW